MAQFEQWFNQDFTEKIEIRHCESVMFSGDDQGAVVGVHLFNGGAEYAGGGTVSGKVIRSDGAEIGLTGTISGNAASVVLLESCLAVPGPIGVYIRLTADNQKATVLSAIYTVQATSTGTIVDPGTIIQGVNDLIDDIEQAVSSIPADYTALLAAVAPTFSATAQYPAGYYAWYDGELYQFTTNHDAGAWDAAQAVKVPLSKAVGEMQDESRIYQYLTNNGQYTVTAVDMENGAWSYSSKVPNTKRVRNANLIPVRAGMQISYSTPTLRLGFWVLASKTVTRSFAQNIGFQAAGSSGTINITADGYLIVMADSTNNITVADYDCRVTICSLNSQLNSFDLINGAITKVSSSMSGVTFAWNAGKCTVSTAAGSASTAIAVNVMQSRALLPVNVSAGETLYVKYTASISGKVFFRIIFYDSENTAIKTYECYEDREITIPDNATQWNLALVVKSGVTINPAVVVSDCKILNAKTNKYISENLFEKYIPDESSFSVWEMPQNSWWSGMKEQFEDSVDIKSELISNVTYRVFKIGGIVFVVAPARKQAYLGQMRVIDLYQFWMTVDEAVGSRGRIPDNTDFDTLTNNGIYVIQSGYTYANAPGFAGTLIVFKASTNIILQLAFSLTGACKARTSVASTFSSPWVDISGGGAVYNNTYVSQNYQNTYNITCSPQITTDTNNFLASTGDNTDRTGEIQAMLNLTGICRLGPGDFYVTGVQVPTRGMLIGSGNATSLVLDESVATGYAVKLTSYSSVKNLRIRGTENPSAVAHPSEVGSRHGIIYESTYPTSGYTGYYRPMIDGCTIYNFNGGGITLNSTGISAAGHAIISNCIIYSCGAGINIPRYSEFHRITNVTAQGCLYGCIDNGGNCNFANCDFSSNENGLLIDNSTGQSPNNTHGSFVGCTFNHTGGNTGIAIRILGGYAGEIFTASQIFFGGIVIDGSIGVRFIGANIGRNVPITINNSKGTTFTDCNLREAAPSEQFPNTDSPISVRNSSVTRFVNCIFEYPSKHQVAANSGNTVFEFEKCYLFDGTVFNPLS